MKKIYIFLFFIVYSMPILAQDITQWLYSGKEDIFAGRYEDALYYFEKIVATQPRHDEALYYASMCYLMLYQHTKALDYIARVRPLQLPQADDYNYWLAHTYFKNEKFVEAEYYLNAYFAQSQLPQGKNADKLRLYLQNAKKFYLMEQKYSIENLAYPVNSPYSELHPILDDRQKRIVFTSTRTLYNDKLKTSESNKKLHTFISDMQNNGKWSSPYSAGFMKGDTSKNDLKIIEDKRLSTSKKLVITPEGELKLIFEEREGWKLPEYYVENPVSMGGKEEYACMSQDGKLYVFSSAIRQKSIDLYMCYRLENNDWTTPRPIGNLNTDKDEISPFLYEENGKKILYFSSEGHTSMGGFDVFYSEFNEKIQRWSDPVNMGYPINSVSDDMHLSLRGETGYFCSNRTGGQGYEDIYRFFTFDKVLVNGVVKDFNTTEPIADCRIEFTTPYGFLVETKTNSKGEYEMALPANEKYTAKVIHNFKTLYWQPFELNARTVAQRKNKMLTQNFFIHTSDKEFLVRMRIDSVETPDSSALAAAENPIEESIPADSLPTSFSAEVGSTFVLSGVFFETGSPEIEDRSFDILEKLGLFLLKYPSLVIEISGHTDNVGNPAQNENLSRLRAEAVREFLREYKGIPVDRIQTIGHGDKFPIASNDEEIGGRELNRRIEVKVLRK